MGWFPKTIRRIGWTAAPVLVLSIIVGACAKRDTPYDTNLLENPSFEIVKGNLPEGWKIEHFRGLDEMKPSTYGLDENIFHSGKRSLVLKGDPDTKRFYALSQEVPVRNVKRVRIRGAIKTVGVDRKVDQYSQANYVLTFFDKDHTRFASARFFDERTKLRLGTSDGWILEDRIFRLPEGTAYVMVSCILGMEGSVWFDDVSLEVPKRLPWRSKETNNIVFYWLPDAVLPEEAMAEEQRLYDYYAGRLGVPEDDRDKFSYYFYPDSATFHAELGVRGALKANWEDREIHTLYPIENHEIIHMITDPIGKLPRALAEGTAFYLQGFYNETPIQPLAQKLLFENKIPALSTQLDVTGLSALDPDLVIPSAASFVGYLIEFGGIERFLRLHKLATGAMTYEGFAPVFEEVYEMPLPTVEERWQATLRAADFSRFNSTDQSK